MKQKSLPNLQDEARNQAREHRCGHIRRTALNFGPQPPSSESWVLLARSSTGVFIYQLSSFPLTILADGHDPEWCGAGGCVTNS